MAHAEIETGAPTKDAPVPVSGTIIGWRSEVAAPTASSSTAAGGGQSLSFSTGRRAGRPLAFVLTLGGSLILWLPSGGAWVAAIRRLTIAGLAVPTDLERAESEALRNEAAREHVVVDATNLADQGSRHYRNRGWRPRPLTRRAKPPAR